jgi:hypothetical protein
VLNNPVNFVDPEGKIFFEVLLFGRGASYTDLFARVGRGRVPKIAEKVNRSLEKQSELQQHRKFPLPEKCPGDLIEQILKKPPNAVPDALDALMDFISFAAKNGLMTLIPPTPTLSTPPSQSVGIKWL